MLSSGPQGKAARREASLLSLLFHMLLSEGSLTRDQYHRPHSQRAEPWLHLYQVQPVSSTALLAQMGQQDL